MKNVKRLEKEAAKSRPTTSSWAD